MNTYNTDKIINKLNPEEYTCDRPLCGRAGCNGINCSHRLKLDDSHIIGQPAMRIELTKEQLAELAEYIADFINKNK